MHKAIKFHGIIYPVDMKPELPYLAWLETLTKREKDLLFVNQLITSARIAKYTPQIATNADEVNLENIIPVLERNGWSMLLDKFECEEGMTTDGNDFYICNTTMTKW